MIPRNMQSPSYMRSNVQKDLLQNTETLKFSPVTPNYKSPSNILSPKKIPQNSTKHIGNMSPSFHYESSPISSNSDIQSYSSSSRIKSDYLEGGQDEFEK